jgi:hypothetical protein
MYAICNGSCLRFCTDSGDKSNDRHQRIDLILSYNDNAMAHLVISRFPAIVAGWTPLYDQAFYQQECIS